MAKTVTALKDVLKREEKLLAKVKDTIVLMVHKESKIMLKALAADKRSAISSLKRIIRSSEKCPAVKPGAKKAASKCKPKAAAKKAAPKKTAAKKKPAAKKKTAAKKK